MTLLLALAAGQGLGAVPGAGDNALAEYVQASDASFAWSKVEQRVIEGLRATRLECVSQTWRGHEWRHEVLVVRPPKVTHPDIAFLLISGDGKGIQQLSLLRELAEQGGAVAAVLNRVPNQPLYDGRKEDALIAYTFDQYLRTGDRTWPLLFPMVKSAVRAMDTVQALARQEFGQKIERFVVGGASKRGWTTWLSAAVDPRVKAIAPMVIDMLNLKVQTDWAQKMYGRQSDQVHDYTEAGIIERMDEPGMAELRRWVDPYSFRARYTMPKLLLLGTNDPYWVVDSLRHYWNELPEPKLVFQTPNAGHDLAGGREAIPALAAFFRMVAEREKLPSMTWHFKSGANVLDIGVKLDRPAKAFRLWTAESPVRDFRQATWSSVELTVKPGAQVTAQVKTPAAGFRAALVEAELGGPGGKSYKLSTEARVTPDEPKS